MLPLHAFRPFALLTLLLACPALARAAGPDGSQLHPLWGVPFVGVLASIALLPMAAPRFWHQHFGKVTAGWSMLFLLPFAAVFGVQAALLGLAHALVAEYIPFILLLLALFTVAGGIHVRSSLRATPLVNAGFLAVGALLASVMGTTGASMVLIRPLLKANEGRRAVAHVVIFFIFIVSNAGGALTPLGDPPLFLGFLAGVDFFWTLKHLWPHTLLLIGALLALFFAIDTWHARRESRRPRPQPQAAGAAPGQPLLQFEGKVNLALLPFIPALVLMSGAWHSGVEWQVAGAHISLPDVLRDAGLVAVTALSLWLTPAAAHRSNQFTWEPMLEVAKLFAGIFITIAPVIAMLQAGMQGPFAGILHAVTRPDGSPIPAMYFWAAGALSSVLDNAPTYLVFFNTAGGSAPALMGPLASTLAAISAGAVFMGANTYIGNAPNLMVKSIAEERGVRMPSFFGYMLWSAGLLTPLFVALTLLFF